jgi:hypothetical protein
MTWNIVRNTEKRAKREKHTVVPGIWRENWNTWKMRNKHCLTWNMAGNTEKRGR